MHKPVQLLVAACLLLALTACTTQPPAPSNTEGAQQSSLGESLTPQPPEPPQQQEPVRQDQPDRYPAYRSEGGPRLWGYLDGSGAFVIPPQFESVEEFGTDGLAVVHQNGQAGLINRSGEFVLPPSASYITSPNDGVRIAFLDGTAKAVDGTGRVLFESAALSHSYGHFGDGLVAFANDGRYGYLDKQGAVAIEPRFTYATNFSGGKAVVGLQDGASAIIDRQGNVLKRLDVYRAADPADGMIAFEEQDTYRWGYLTLEGERVIPAQFTVAWPFSGGQAIVQLPGDGGGADRVGVIDRKGEYVIPPVYGTIDLLGDGLYAVTLADEDFTQALFSPSAIFNAAGQQLTDFLYYDVSRTGDYISVSDETHTYLLDTTGRRAAEMPSAEGIGTIRLSGDLLAMQIDGTLRYVTRDGKTVWEAEESWELANGARVVRRTQRAGRNMLVEYPEVTGLPDSQVQASINDRLRTLFLAPLTALSDEDDVSYTANFSVQQVGSVLVVQRSSHTYFKGAAHGMPSMEYIHLSLETAAEYALADLFRPDSDYTVRLSELVSQQLLEDDRGVDVANPSVSPDQPFAVGPDGLLIYWYPYDIAPYAAGFPTFHIPWEAVLDLIDTDGAFWKALGLAQ